MDTRLYVCRLDLYFDAVGDASNTQTWSDGGIVYILYGSLN